MLKLSFNHYFKLVASVDDNSEFFVAKLLMGPWILLVCAWTEELKIDIKYLELLSWPSDIGPDLSADHAGFISHLDLSLINDANYFKNHSLFEVVSGSYIFNGFAGYAANEIVERLYFHFGMASLTLFYIVV